MADAKDDGFPDYVEGVADVFEEVYEREHGDLGWIEPISDDNLGGCTRHGNPG